MLTNRDREYLRIIYLLNGSTQPIGPVKLSKKIGVSKVCAFQKMHRLQALGYGTYVHREGLKLNKKAEKIVEKDMKRHHVLESYLQQHLQLSHKQACVEAEKLDQSISQILFNKIKAADDRFSSSCCSYDPNKKLTCADLKDCPWIKRLVTTN
ncbi:MAG: metal-dependent transcriptional regulator [Thermoplasmatota archaeon]